MATTRVDQYPAIMRHVMAINGNDVGSVPVVTPPQKTTVSTIATAGAVSYTADQLIGGLILRDPNGAARADLVPTAALLVAALPGAFIGQSVEFVIRNTADAAETITVTTATGATLSGTMTIAQSASRRFLAVLTNVTAGAHAYSVYSVGAFTT
jgi:hypothetical protein